MGVLPLPLLALWALAPPARATGATPAAPGCHVTTFTSSSPAGWVARNIEDPPEGREGCLYVRPREDESFGAAIYVESARETLAMFRKGDPVETLVGKITDGLAKNMNVVVKRLTYRNDDMKRGPRSPIDRASMFVFEAEVPGDPRGHEAVVAVAHAPGRYFTVIVVTPSEKADPKLSEASHAAFREIMNSLATP